MDQMFNFFIQPGNVKVQDEYNNELFSLLLYDNKKKKPLHLNVVTHWQFYDWDSFSFVLT